MFVNGPNGRVTFGWDLTYLCNYHCPYCTVWDQSSPPAVSVAEWSRHWERMHRLYGECYIYMSGGEPSVYPHFIELVKALTRWHIVDICTNLSWKVQDLIPAISTDRLRIAATFHPSHVRMERFLPNVLAVKDYLPMRDEGRVVYYVAYPSQVPLMSQQAALLKGHGLALVALPFVATDHVMGNTDEEKEVIRAVSSNREDQQKMEYQLKELSPKGRMCRAGQRYAMIRGDGRVDRCSQFTDRQLGAFVDDRFKLWSEPKLCTVEWCPYESQWIVND
ncbi:MAG TPA: radical SAM protein [Elusimicrobiota bacterium]|nr:radical SAM protein [Elusimicrobiota bacterium]